LSKRKIKSEIKTRIKSKRKIKNGTACALGFIKRSPCRGDGKETRGRGGGANRPSLTVSGEKQHGFFDGRPASAHAVRPQSAPRRCRKLVKVSHVWVPIPGLRPNRLATPVPGIIF